MILSLIVALAIIVGTALLLVHSVKMVRTSKRRAATVFFGVLLGVALVVGIRFGVFGEFQLSERIRIQGAPIPLVVFVLEGQNWTDFVKPAFVCYICMAANAVFPVGLVGLLWTLFLMESPLTKASRVSRTD